MRNEKREMRNDGNLFSLNAKKATEIPDSSFLITFTVLLS